MKFIFIDEFEGVKQKGIFGIAMIVVDATKYDRICSEFYRILKKTNWEQGKELKGSYVFSRNPAGQTKTPEEMISIIKDIVSVIAGNTNAACELIAVYNQSGRSKENYISLVGSGITKIKRNSKGGIKKLCAVYFDRWDPLTEKNTKNHLDNDVHLSLKERGYGLVENTTCPVISSNETPGIVFVDILAHLSRWIIENPSKRDITLLDLIYNPNNTDRKINIAHSMIEKIKNKKFIEQV